MLPPEYLAGAPDWLAALYGEVEQDILRNMAERIAAYDFYIPAAQHQHQKLRAMGVLEDDIEAQLAGMSGKSREEIQRLMQEAVKKSLTTDAAVYAAAGMGRVDPLQAAGVKRILRDGMAQTNGLFVNLTRTTANTATKQFEDALDRAWLKVSTGAFDYNSAVRTAVKDLSRQGVGAIQYPSGHIDTIEAAVRRAVVTGVNQTSAKSQLALMDELDVDLVETTAHAGARPDHQEWQGQVFCRKGHHPKYRDFVESTGYGTGAGLCGWNCRHSFYPFLEGASRAYTRDMLEGYAAKNYTYNGQKMTEYEATQQQRYIERQIRRWKREGTAMRAAGQPTDEAAAKVAAWQGRMRDFLSQTGLKRDGAREQVGNAVFTLSPESGIMKPAERKAGNVDVQYVGKIDKELFRCVSENITTDEVIITDERVQHIKERHPGDYERYFEYLTRIVENPDYILEANKPDSALLLKHIEDNGKNYKLILRLKTSHDPEGFKNSVITFQKVEDRRYTRYTKSEKVLYKRE